MNQFTEIFRRNMTEDRLNESLSRSLVMWRHWHISFFFSPHHMCEVPEWTRSKTRRETTTLAVELVVTDVEQKLMKFLFFSSSLLKTSRNDALDKHSIKDLFAFDQKSAHLHFEWLIDFSTPSLSLPNAHNRPRWAFVSLSLLPGLDYSRLLASSMKTEISRSTTRHLYYLNY